MHGQEVAIGHGVASGLGGPGGRARAGAGVATTTAAEVTASCGTRARGYSGSSSRTVAVAATSALIATPDVLVTGCMSRSLFWRRRIALS